MPQAFFVAQVKFSAIGHLTSHNSYSTKHQYIMPFMCRFSALQNSNNNQENIKPAPQDVEKPVKFRLVDSLADLRAPLTGSQHVKHVVGEVVLLAKLSWKLLTFLGIGWKWTISLLRLMLYTALLLPAFLQMILFYYFSKRLTLGVPYGRKPRNFLDIYMPYRYWLDKGPVPVVIFVTGGAWIIGYKAWGALLGRRLSQQGVLVFSLDYRNFPQGKCPDMLEDINTGISWVLRHAGQYGGDLDNVYVCGQSCQSPKTDKVIKK
eukprot:TRINITY_DN5596_c0_g1_i8.p1 TRINITY_DN5596_c0_g1~~TRINITY_DN5596_c0_g1_i8.p1  ORF type:complete len:263 (-),score=13.24 TRINITY_DN5596_c0_g1_i8:56-844(-)